jgi:hypothetical protein
MTVTVLLKNSISVLEEPAACILCIKVKVKVAVWGLFSTAALWLVVLLPPEIVPSSPEALCTKWRERPLLAKEGRKLDTRTLPAPRNLLQVLGSFTCPKVGTLGRLFNFPSEGRHAEDFYI